MEISCARQPRPALSARVGMNWIKATRLPDSYRNHHLRRPDIDTTDMDDIRKSLSKLKKDFKHRVGRKKRAAGGAGDNATEETAGSSLSPMRPDPRVATSGHDGEGGRISTGVSQAHSRDRSPRPKPMQADEGSDDSRGRGAGVDEKGTSQSRSDPGLDVGGAAGSRTGQQIKRALSPLPVTTMSPKQEPDSMWTFHPHRSCLITLLNNADTPTIPDHVQEDPRPEDNTEPNAIADEKKSSWKSTALATAKLLLRGVRDSADAFGPLKSVAGGLCFILENCEVWNHPCLHSHGPHRYPSE